jgi:hypothetical protein
VAELIFTSPSGCSAALFSWRFIESLALRTRYVLVGIVNSAVNVVKSLASLMLAVG